MTGALVNGVMLLVCELTYVTGKLETVLCELCKGVTAEITLWVRASGVFPKLAVTEGDLCIYERETSGIGDKGGGPLATAECD